MNRLCVPALARRALGLLPLTILLASCSLISDPFKEGERKLRAEDWFGAIDAYTEAIEAGEYPVVAYANRCYAYQAAGRFDAAEDDCTEALDLIGDPPDDDEAGLRQFTEILNNRAVAKIGMRDYEDAIADLDWALRLRDEYAEAYANRGRARVELEEWDAAIEDLERAVELAPDLPEAYGNWAQALVGLGDVDGALEKFAQAIEVSGGSPEIHFNRASLLYGTGKFEQALADYRVVAERSTNEQLKWMAEQQVIFLEGLERSGTPAPSPTPEVLEEALPGTDSGGETPVAPPTDGAIGPADSSTETEDSTVTPRPTRP
jgi:tetratricopeptide (TPR) repeat protein